MYPRAKLRCASIFFKPTLTPKGDTPAKSARGHLSVRPGTKVKAALSAENGPVEVRQLRRFSFTPPPPFSTAGSARNFDIRPLTPTYKSCASLCLCRQRSPILASASGPGTVRGPKFGRGPLKLNR